VPQLHTFFFAGGGSGFALGGLDGSAATDADGAPASSIDWNLFSSHAQSASRPRRSAVFMRASYRNRATTRAPKRWAT